MWACLRVLVIGPYTKALAYRHYREGGRNPQVIGANQRLHISSCHHIALLHDLVWTQFYDTLRPGRSPTTCLSRDAVLRHALGGMQFYDMPVGLRVVFMSGIYKWCLRVVFTSGVYVLCLRVVFTSGVYALCLRVVFTSGVYM